MSPAPPAPPASGDALKTLIDQLIEEQQTMTPVEAFAAWHDKSPALAPQYRRLIPAAKPGVGEQYAFEVNVSACTGCKACVSACHSLNGLDENETWRDVGLLLGGTRKSPVQQVITTACHHCADPACANGCPVLAYEKDEETGIVRHLDDQCIGCQYCILKCPYDVPKYSKARGIVRKCDMCLSRLAEGEAPACVQACPNEAIRIVTVSRESLFDSAARAERLTPGTVESGYTHPSTVFTGLHPAANLRAADAAAVREEPAHWPLVVMLFLTQAATGLLCAAAVVPGHPFPLRLAGAILLALGVVASTTHLGQPLKAWRAFLGWRKSWLSREILAFGAAAPAACLAVIAPNLSGWLTNYLPGVATSFPKAVSFLASPDFLTATCLGAVLTAAVSVLCSIMVYADTRRALWKFPITAFSMAGGTLAVAAAALSIATGQPLPAAIAILLVMGRTIAVSRFTHRWRNESPLSHPHAKSARLMYGPLSFWWHVRLFTAMGAALLMFSFPATGLALVLVSEFCERLLFFKAVVALKMPGIP
jgi:formate dehydrogenase iron-sulfur subunit